MSMDHTSEEAPTLPPWPGTYRKVPGGYKKMPSKVDLTPITPVGTLLSIQGRPRKPLKVGGVHLILFPKFSDWLKKSPRRAAQWKNVKDKARYFLKLSTAAFLPPNSEFAKRPLEYCQTLAPELTGASLPLLRKRAKKVMSDDYSAACSAPSYGTVDETCKLSARECDRRKKMRAAAMRFETETGGKAI